MPAKKEVIKELITHVLVPEHIKLTDKEKEEVFQQYNISIRELPKIFKSDSALINLNVKENDVIKIIRKDAANNASVFYRGVINE